MSVSVPLSGELTHLVTIFRRTDSPNAEAGLKNTDTEICKAWAKHEPTGVMYWNATQVDERANDRFWVRQVQGLTDVRTLCHGVLLKEGGITYRPVRVTDANGAGTWTIIEAAPLGEVALEESSSSTIVRESDLG